MPEPWVRPTGVALRRLRRLLVSQRFTDSEVTGVLIVILGKLPMNGFIIDIIVYNNIAPLRYSSYSYSLYHRLNGSSSPVLTATCLSYGRLCDFLGFFSRTDLEVTPLDRF